MIVIQSKWKKSRINCRDCDWVSDWSKDKLLVVRAKAKHRCGYLSAEEVQLGPRQQPGTIHGSATPWLRPQRERS